MAQSVGDDDLLDSTSLSCAMWKTCAHVSEKAGSLPQEAFKCHLQRVVDIFTTG